MTRQVAVVGTSNIGAVKYAAAAIAAAHPDLSVAFYGLPGGRFAEAGVDAAGRFQPAPEDAATRKLSLRVNGTEALDLTRFDAVLAVCDTLGMPQTLFVAAQYDVADWPTRRDKPLISTPAFLSAMEEAIAIRADRLRQQFRGIHPLFIAPAPYPSVAVTRRGRHRQEPYASVADHPELPRLHALYRDALARALSEREITLVLQPDETIAAPFLTKPEYAQGAEDFREAGRVLDDHRHMNAAFGASLFRAFALALGPTAARADETAQIKE